ncbi:DUF1772 domain-containing protein [Pseudooceanicola sp. 200-1SW]|uniref:anthrone oxygenase family protein n=1 Tax=Pseudooceanicola sp. 200-1SW TaxID=3425949 RepID=UPI003D7F6E45
MLSPLVPFAAGVAALLVSGVFLSFSDFVIRGIAQAPIRAGAAAMQGLNRTVYRSLFMVLLIGLLPVSLLLAGAGLAGALPHAPLLIAAALTYVLGVAVVTGRGNVPMNHRLDAMSATGSEAQAYWPRYARDWTRLNHIRTAAAALSGLLWLLAAR